MQIKPKQAGLVMLSAIFGGAITFFALPIQQKQTNPEPGVSSIVASDKPECKYNLNRLKGYKYVHPIFSAAPECESSNYKSLKSSISSAIENEKQAGNLSTASVYFMSLSDDSWMSINANATYHPGSLLKIVNLITYLKMAETDHGILQRKIEYKKGEVFAMSQTFNSKTIVPGRSYTVRELLHSMIANSDNYATTLLTNHMDTTIFLNAFSDMGISRPNLQDIGYTISPRDFSMFLRVLYDAGYLSIPSSEEAITLLTQCDFKDGILEGLPASIKVAHKFGEAGFGNVHELHESAIVFLEGNPYLITIMTRGADVRRQEKAISRISEMVFNNMGVAL